METFKKFNNSQKENIEKHGTKKLQFSFGCNFEMTSLNQNFQSFDKNSKFMKFLSSFKVMSRLNDVISKLHPNENCNFLVPLMRT